MFDEDALRVRVRRVLRVMADVFWGCLPGHDFPFFGIVPRPQSLLKARGQAATCVS